MSIYNFAKLNVELSPRGITLKKQLPKYAVKENCDSLKPDISLNVSMENIITAHQRYRHLTFDDCEYMLLGEQFYTKLLSYDGFLLHSSAVEYQGKAYLFSAPSGTGKSTHVSIWRKIFPECVCINDDKPALRLIDGVFHACGTPFSGKTDTSENICVPIQGICVLSRGEHNSIEKLSAAEAVYHILNQTIRPKDITCMDSLLKLIDSLSKKVGIYSLKCNMLDEAALVSFNGMNEIDSK